ncbi:outer membrane lipoprotein carrier protein LolA [Rhodonellum sp.]|uniref:LolA family protein n=1 Tax=Rhodonellum sp. TaxID=2231180 RepID=UPI0027258C79|nr:outer membrane lipoprotein carrier protein LolA [Rhodonellum sp.]MDO9552323.1 outer membrane lipoprotein carrier protein LolA [Rhodonellum sp.]
MLKKIAFSLLFVTGFFFNGFSQQDTNAKAILDGVSEKYQSLKGLKASFEFSYSHSGDGVNQTQTGEIAVKGDKYRLKLPEQEIFNNGKTIWTYIVSGNYKEVTINYAGETEDELTPSSVYNIYKKGYNYRLIGEKTENGNVIQEVELTAINSGTPFKKVILFVVKAKKDLAGWEIYDDQGGVFKYRFKSVNTQENLADDYFNFNPKQYGKIEIIDLR